MTSGSLPGTGTMPPTLSPEQHAHLEREGWLRVPGVLDAARARATAEAICGFIGVELDRPETWYRWPPEAWSVVPVHQAQVLWDNRQDPRVVQPFVELLGTDELWVSMDRASFKPPLSWRRPHRQDTPIHWDADPRTVDRNALQGLLYLTDVSEGGGGFECVPSLYRNLAAYLATHPEPKGEPDWKGYPLVEVPGRAGDLIVWKQRLPHRGGANLGKAPRVTQYLTYFPRGTEAERIERVANWRERRAPAGWRGWPGQQDPEPWPSATLTPLGRRLLGDVSP